MQASDSRSVSTSNASKEHNHQLLQEQLFLQQFRDKLPLWCIFFLFKKQSVFCTTRRHTSILQISATAEGFSVQQTYKHGTQGMNLRAEGEPITLQTHHLTGMIWKTLTNNVLMILNLSYLKTSTHHSAAGWELSSRIHRKVTLMFHIIWIQ